MQDLLMPGAEIGRHSDKKGETYELDHFRVSSRDPTVNCRVTVLRGAIPSSRSPYHPDPC